MLIKSCPGAIAKNSDIEITHRIMYTQIMKAKLPKNSNKHSKHTDEILAAIDYGIDISMLIDNMHRSPSERIRRHQIALNTAEKLRSGRHL